MCIILIRSPLPNIVTKFYVYNSYSLSSDKYSHQVLCVWFLFTLLCQIKSPSFMCIILIHSPLPNKVTKFYVYNSYLLSSDKYSHQVLCVWFLFALLCQIKSPSFMCIILIHSPLPNKVTKFYVYNSYSLFSDKYSHQVLCVWFLFALLCQIKSPSFMCMILICSPLPNIVNKFYVYNSYSLSSDKYSHQVLCVWFLFTLLCQIKSPSFMCIILIHSPLTNIVIKFYVYDSYSLSSAK